MKLALLLFTAVALFGQLKMTSGVGLQGYTAAQLGSYAPAANTFAVQTDSLSATCSGAITGGGSTRCIVLYGAAWAYAGGAASTLQFQASISSPTTTLAITAGYSSIDSVVTTTAASTGVLSGSTASSTVYGYIDGLTGAPTLGHNGAATLSSAAWTIATGITDFPAQSRPLFVATYVSNAFTAVTNYMPSAALFTAIAGSGVSIAYGAGGQATFSNLNTKVQQEMYFSPAGETDGGTGVYGPITCFGTTGCATSELTAGNRKWPTVAFSDSGTTLSSAIYWRIPSNWDGGAITMLLDWTRGSGAGATMVWSTQTVCYANNEDVTGTSYNTAQVSTGQTAPSVATRAEYSLSLTLTGCAAGETLVVMPSRASGDASDDLAATVHILGAVLSYKANLTN